MIISSSHELVLTITNRLVTMSNGLVLTAVMSVTHQPSALTLSPSFLLSVSV